MVNLCKTIKHTWIVAFWERWSWLVPNPGSPTTWILVPNSDRGWPFTVAVAVQALVSCILVVEAVDWLMGCTAAVRQGWWWLSSWILAPLCSCWCWLWVNAVSSSGDSCWILEMVAPCWWWWLSSAAVTMVPSSKTWTLWAVVSFCCICEGPAIVVISCCCCCSWLLCVINVLVGTDSGCGGYHSSTRIKIRNKIYSCLMISFFGLKNSN